VRLLPDRQHFAVHRRRNLNVSGSRGPIHQEQHQPEQIVQHQRQPRLSKPPAFTGSLPTTTNPIDNQRFFVWQQYADFPGSEPDENGLDFWTGNITGTCSTGFNDKTSCTATKRIDVSRAFFVAAYPSLFTSGGTQLTNNADFLHKCYEVFLRRSVSSSDGGFQFWLNDLNSYGNPANQNGINHLIDAFTSSIEYRQRFGQ
jgi:hypothetical protein